MSKRKMHPRRILYELPATAQRQLDKIRQAADELDAEVSAINLPRINAKSTRSSTCVGLGTVHESKRAHAERRSNRSKSVGPLSASVEALRRASDLGSEQKLARSSLPLLRDASCLSGAKKSAVDRSQLCRDDLVSRSVSISPSVVQLASQRTFQRTSSKKRMPFKQVEALSLCLLIRIILIVNIMSCFLIFCLSYFGEYSICI